MSDFELVDAKRIGTNVSQRAIDKLLSISEGKFKEAWAKRRNKNVQAFSTYLANTIQYCRAVKNILSSGDSVDIEKVYIEPTIRTETAPKSFKKFVDYVDAERKKSEGRPALAIAIEGSAGIGKTMLLKSLFLRLLSDQFSRIPLFLELRGMEPKNGVHIEDLIAQQMRLHDPGLMSEQIKLGLQGGVFTLLFDGFDEIARKDQEFFENELKRLAVQYPNNPIVVSGRPHAAMMTWPTFSSGRIQFLTLRQAVSLINRLPYPASTKSSFNKLLKEKLFDSHRDFAEVPLLLSIMLLTYNHVGTISSRRHEFYEDAYDALWSKHDLKSKSGWQRQRSTRLSKSNFTDFLSAFCFSAYLDEQYVFDTNTIHHHLKHAVRLTGLRVDADEFWSDLTLSLSLVVREGRAFKFVHRTFQEYFAALFIVRTDDETMREVLDGIRDRVFIDYVFTLSFSMSKKRIERNFLLEIANRFSWAFEDGLVSIENYLDIMDDEDIDILRLMYGARYQYADLSEIKDMFYSNAKAILEEQGGDFFEIMNTELDSREPGFPIFEDRKKLGVIINNILKDCDRDRSEIRELLKLKQEQFD